MDFTYAYSDRVQPGEKLGDHVVLVEDLAAQQWVGAGVENTGAA